MAKEIIVKPLGITADLNGITFKAVLEHFKLYEGYIKKINEIRTKIETVDKQLANATYSEIGELKRQESFAADGVKLHEIYFSILGGNGESSGKVAQLINRDFGSLENWMADMTAAGLSARGWVILSYDLADKSLHNYSADAHNVGLVVGTIPLITLDVYEHAYFMDYGVNRKGYIEAFFKNLNWKKIDEIAEEHKIQ
ncbi:MAG: superoxide dismutase [Candidatus Liptonbacteria bacterium]|nr:superoxide dismutase [Candidatus Liptonbacteria bacterium]